MSIKGSMTVTVTNKITKKTRKVNVSLDHVRRVVTQDDNDECSGPCECYADPDGCCPNGWPSKTMAVGVS